tara:strand:+ start:648 stop:1109 length:462 start_codon:yes stop_codon:yes gene_type:complete
MNPKSWLCLKRTVRFGDCDPAGVIHFYQLFRWCHEAWEESLELYGLSSLDLFPGGENFRDDALIALPIIHCEANFRLPIKTGDNLEVILKPKRIDLTKFQVIFEFKINEQKVAIALLKHISINSQNRKRCQLPEGIDKWLESSSITLGVNPAN